MSQRLSTALDLASKYNFRVFPQDRNKKPLIRDWPNMATSDVEQIRSWAKQFPNCNFAMVTGDEYIALDVDIKNDQKGDESYRKLIAKFGKLITYKVRTPSGGAHLLLKIPPGTIVKNLSGLPGFPGIEVKGQGGCITLPRSIYKSGAEYKLVADPGIADCPADLLALILKGSEARSRPVEVGKISEGHRDIELFKTGCGWRSRGMELAEIEIGLLLLNKTLAKPLPETQVREKAAQAVKYKPGSAGGNGDGQAAPDSEIPGEISGDLSHASVLAEYFKGQYRWAFHRGSWMQWTGKVWESIQEERMAKIASDVLRKIYAEQIAQAADERAIKHFIAMVRQSCSVSKIASALSFAKGFKHISTGPDLWDSHDWLLNVDNGILDLKTCTLSPHDPDLLLTKITPAAYRPEAKGPAWEAHLELFLPDDNIRRQVRRDLGMNLSGAVLEEKLEMWIGTGGNGKSTTMAVLKNVIGAYIREAVADLLIESKFEKHPTELADLEGLRIVISSEIGKGKKLDERLVKDLTGGGQAMRARFMRADFFDVRKTFSIILLANYYPVIAGTDHAIWRRVRLIPWHVRITESEKLPQVEAVAMLSAEKDAILTWLIAGLQDWQSDPKWTAPEVLLATAEYRKEQDRLGQFLVDMVEQSPRFTVPVKELFSTYEFWCTETGEEALSKRVFGLKLKDIGMSTKKEGHSHVTVWRGLRLSRGQKTENANRGEPTVSNPNEKMSCPEEQEGRYATVRKGHNDLTEIDEKTLKSKAEKLKKYLDDQTVPIEQKELEKPAYDALLAELSRRSK